MRCTLFLKNLWQLFWSHSSREPRERFSMEIDGIVIIGKHQLITTPGFLFPHFWRGLCPFLLHLLVPLNFLMPRVLLCDLILLFVLLLLSWKVVTKLTCAYTLRVLCCAWQFPNNLKSPNAHFIEPRSNPRFFECIFSQLPELLLACLCKQLLLSGPALAITPFEGLDNWEHHIGCICKRGTCRWAKDFCHLIEIPS